jgi:flagellar biosynthesis/type III secretory pathway chaperone
MTPQLIAAAEHLATILEAENAALSAFDMPRIASLLGDKTLALQGFHTARALAKNGSFGTLDPVQRKAAEELTVRLRQLAEQNRTLLERAMFVQTKVISIFARAMPKALAAQTTRYRANGSLAALVTPPALTLRSRV